MTEVLVADLEATGGALDRYLLWRLVTTVGDDLMAPALPTAEGVRVECVRGGWVGKNARPLGVEVQVTFYLNAGDRDPSSCPIAGEGTFVRDNPLNPWTVAAWVGGAFAALYVLHRLALWLEREGWIRYVRSPPDRGAGAAAAFGELQQLLEPKTRHVYELKEEQKKPRREAEGGEPGPPQPPA
jgi:hypothetical protein